MSEQDIQDLKQKQHIKSSSIFNRRHGVLFIPQDQFS